MKHERNVGWRKNKHAPLPGKTLLATHNSGHSIFKTMRHHKMFQQLSAEADKYCQAGKHVWYALFSFPSCLLPLSCGCLCNIQGPDSRSPQSQAALNLDPSLELQTHPSTHQQHIHSLRACIGRNGLKIPHWDFFVSQTLVTEKIKVILQFILWCKWLMKVSCVSPPKDIFTFQSGHWFTYTHYYI